LLSQIAQVETVDKTIFLHHQNNLIFTTMGKNKWYFEVENSSNHAGSPKSDPNAFRSKKANLSPSPFVWESPENMPLPKLFKLVFARLKRTWVALTHSADAVTFGLFRKKTLIQLCIFAGTGFILLAPSSDGDPSGSESGPRAHLVHETALDLGREDEPRRTISETERAPKEKKKPGTDNPLKPHSRKNEAAPVSAEELLKQQSLDYINRFSKIAQGEMAKFGIPASISLAQGLIESRAGTSKLAVSNNNHFGMKCFAKNCAKGHCSNHTDDTHKDFFRKYNNAWESWRAHSQLLASGRYEKLKRHGRDYRAWANGLQSAGYATDKKYASKLIGIIERYDLHCYDR